MCGTRAFHSRISLFSLEVKNAVSSLCVIVVLAEIDAMMLWQVNGRTKEAFENHKFVGLELL